MDERVRSKVIELMRAWSRPQPELTEPVGRGLGGDDQSDVEGGVGERVPVKSIQARVMEWLADVKGD